MNIKRRNYNLNIKLLLVVLKVDVKDCRIQWKHIKYNCIYSLFWIIMSIIFIIKGGRVDNRLDFFFFSFYPEWTSCVFRHLVFYFVFLFWFVCKEVLGS